MKFARQNYKTTNNESDLAQKKAEIDKKRDEILKNNNIVLKDAMNRNIIFVGKTRSGKSTALQVLKKPQTLVSPGSIFSETIDARISHFTVEMSTEDEAKVNFNISIIDTPGLFEVKDKGTTRDNDTLEEIVLKCMNEEITKINSIFFVVAYGSSGINPQDIDSLEAFIKLFHGAEKHLQVLITKCEKLNDADKKKIENDFRNYPQMKELLKIVNPKIYFLGAVEQSDYENGFIDSYELTLKNVMDLRQTMFMDIFNREDYFELNMLKMVDSVRTKTDALYKELQKTFSNKDQLQDAELAKLRDGCKRLDNVLPLLDANSYENAKKFLYDVLQFIDQKTK